jgi:hypothetical protein
MLQCLSSPDPTVTESCLDYFFVMNIVPLAERHPQLGPPLYQVWTAGSHADSSNTAMMTFMRQRILLDGMHACI